jgi:hypothetical protein
MVLISASDPPGANIPEPGFLECATAMPFGRIFVASDAPTFWPNPPRWNPEKGLEHAIPALGWSCETSFGDESEGQAVARLRAALRCGPVMLGPLDFGYLSYSPASEHMPGTDHYVVGLELQDTNIRVHDPAGYPFAQLPLADFLQAWKAVRIGYRQGPYTLRGCFRRERSVSRRHIIDETLTLAGVLMRQTPVADNLFGGGEALERLADCVRDNIPESLERNLLGFALPTAARRATDAISFLVEGNRSDAAAVMQEQAVLWGDALSVGARRQWHTLADVLEEIADTERELARVLPLGPETLEPTTHSSSGATSSRRSRRAES